MATLKDVAKLAHVSPSTVSNIINNKFNSGEDVYQRVTAAIKELKYHPSMNARNLKNNDTCYIGIIVPSVKGHYGDMVGAILDASNDTRYHIVVRTTMGLEISENKAIDEFLDLGIKGLLIVTCQSKMPEKLKNFPCVFIESYFEDAECSYVVFDNRTAIKNYTRNYIEVNGAENLYLVTGPSHISCEREYRKGFTEVLDEYGANIPDKLIEVPQSEATAFSQFMKRLPELKDATFITTSEITASCLREAVEILGTGNKVNTIIGSSWQHFNQDARYGTVNINFENCGKSAFSILLEWISLPVKYETAQVVLVCNSEQREKIFVPLHETTDKLRMILVGVSASDALVRLLPNFENRFGVKVEYDIFHYHKLWETLNQEAIERSQKYDVVMLDYPWYDNLIKTGYLARLNDRLETDEDGFISNYDDYVIKNMINTHGGIYALPYLVGNQLLFYRSDVFSSAALKRAYYMKYGIELAPPKTWNEFNMIACFFTQKYNPDSPFLYGTSINKGLTSIVTQFIPRQRAYHGNFFSPQGEPTVVSTQNLKALNNLIESFKYSGVENEFDETDPIMDLINGNVPMLISFSSHMVESYSEMLFGMREKIGIAPIPGGYPMLSDWRIAVNEHSCSKEAAYRFVKWACSNCLSIHNILLGGSVPKKIVMECGMLNAEYPWQLAMINQIGNGVTREVIWTKHGDMINANEFEDIFAQVAFNAINGNLDAKKALEIADKQFKEHITNRQQSAGAADLNQSKT